MCEYMPISTVPLSLPKLHFTTFCPSIVAECRISSVHHRLFWDTIPCSPKPQCQNTVSSGFKPHASEFALFHDKDMIYIGWLELCCHPVAVFSTHLHIDNTQNNTNNNKLGRVRAVPRLCEFYPGICLTTEEKARKNLSLGKKNLSQVRKTSVRVQYTYYQNTHTLQNLHTHTHTHTHTHAHTTPTRINYKKGTKFFLFQGIGHACSSVPCFDFTQTPTASLFTFDLFVLTILTL